MTKAAETAGFKVTAAPVGNVGEVGDVTRSLCGQKVDAIELFGNAAHAGFGAPHQGGEGVQGPGLLTRAIRGDAGRHRLILS